VPSGSVGLLISSTANAPPGRSRSLPGGTNR